MCDIIEVTPASKMLASVYTLWRANSDTLGFMPRDGFDQAAERTTLVAAVRNDALLGVSAPSG